MSASSSCRIVRTVLALGALGLVLMGVWLPVDLVIRRAIPPRIIAEILARGTPERVTELQDQLRGGLFFFRLGCVALGAWGLLVAAGWRRGVRWAADVRWEGEPLALEKRPVRGSLWGWPALWMAVMIVASLPVLRQGFEHEELLVLDMMARRGPIISAACQNLPARAVQPGYTVLESLVVRAWDDREAVVRLPALLMGAAAMFPVFFLAYGYGSLLLANMTCAVLATTGFFHFYVTYARGYSPSMTASLAAVALLLTLRRSTSWRRWWGVGALMFYACYAHQASAVYLSVTGLIALIDRAVLAARAERSVAHVARALTPPVVVFGTTVLLLFLAYAPGIPASLAYTRVFDLTDYYMAYHINVRFLRVMADLLAWCRGIPVAGALQMALAAAGVVLLIRSSWLTTVYLLTPLVLAVAAFRAMDLFVYPRYFIMFVPLYVLASAVPIAKALSVPVRRSRIVLVALVALGAVGSAVSLERLYRQERCGVRQAVRDALEARQGNEDRIMAMLDAYLTVQHYDPDVVSGFRDTDFWKEVRSDNPPEFIITMPLGIVECDIPGGSEALQERYEVWRAYPSWLDSDDDQDAVYLWRRKPVEAGRGES